MIPKKKRAYPKKALNNPKLGSSAGCPKVTNKNDAEKRSAFFTKEN